MKVLHLFDHSLPIQDGYAYRSLNILLQQRALGWETEHVTSSQQGASDDAVETVEGLEFQRTRMSSSAHVRLPLLNYYEIVRSLRQRTIELILIDRPDILHAHSPPLVGLAAIQAGAAHGVPVIYEVRAFWEDAAVDKGACREGDFRYRATRALESYVLRRAHGVTCICKGLYDDIRARGITEDKLQVIPNAINPEQFPPGRTYDSTLAAEFGLKRGKTLGFVGSFYAYEGLNLAVAALPEMLSVHPDLKLLLVGGGNESDNLHQQVQSLGLQDHVIFTGRVPHAEVSRYYDLIDVLVYPRTAMRLTELVTPLKPLEAMAQERLVIASDVGGHRELIRHEITGLLFSADDATALARAGLRLLGDKVLQEQLRRQALDFVTTERSWVASVGRYPEVYARAQAAASI